MSQKRIRSSNWDNEEKQLLCNILKKHKHVIENKSLTTNNSKAKAKAWNEICKRFNESNSRHRELCQIQVQWKTMKMSARKECSLFNKNVLKTGGGERPPSPDNIHNEVKDLLNPGELLRDFNIYDSDGFICNKTDSQLQDEKNILDIDPIQKSCLKVETIVKDQSTKDANIILDIDPIQKVETIVKDQSTKETPINISKLPPNKLEPTPKKKVLNNASVSKRTDRITEFKKKLDYRTDMVNHTKLLKEEEHQRRMEMAEEEHALKIQILQESLSCTIIEREILDLKKDLQTKININ